MPIKHGARLAKCSRNFARVSFKPMVSPGFVKLTEVTPKFR